MATQAQNIHSMEDFHRILEESTQQPVLLFKYSPICPVSFHAQSEFENFLKSAPDNWKIYQINVVGDKPTSRELATEIGVVHESPQALLFSNKKCIWNASHGEVNTSSLQAQTSVV